MISYDPDEKPGIDPEANAEAEKLGMRLIHVICDERGAQVGDAGAVSFMAMSPYLPRPGERIILEDGTTCDVLRVIHKVTRGPLKAPMLVPNVIAVRAS